MKIINKEYPRENIYPVESLTKGLTPVLFDIETTGLSPKNSYLYIIGALVIKKDLMHFIQWFAEKPSEEEEMLKSFLSFIPEKACLIHFNGRGFDVPFLGAKCKDYNLPNYLAQMANVDLYRAFAPLKDYFNMTSRRLVAYEKLIGLDREDQYNGKELIDVYKEYIGRMKFDKEGAEKLFDMLVLHNEEDIKDMVPCLSLFSYLDLTAGNFASYQINEASHALTLEITGFYPFPIEFKRSIATMPNLASIDVHTAGCTATLTIPTVTTRLRHYFDDYKNYYYLPEEDTAVHKSVASSVDPKHRTNATKATAYTYASGTFIPCFTNEISPSFKYELSDRLSFIPIKALSSDEVIKKYLKSMF